MSNAARKNGVIDQGNYKNVQLNENIQKGNIISRMILVLRTNILGFFVIQIPPPSMPFCGPHKKSQGVRGLIKNDHIQFDPNLGDGISAIH